MKAVYAWTGVTRQATYQHRKRQAERKRSEDAIIEQVQQIRYRHKRMGTRKLLEKIKSWLEANGLKYGRDRLFELLRAHGLLVKPLRRRHRTTRSGLWRCPNILAEAEITGPNQAWVSDITYLETEGGNSYLSLVTDVFSRRIMGCYLSQSLTAEGTIRALQQAIRQAKGRVNKLIHHSDHGIQYTCHAYRERLEKYGIRQSMGEIGNCYDNALAERVIGILKIEYGLQDLFVSNARAKQAVREAVWLYNYERPHLSLNYQSPHEVYINHCSVMVH